MRNLLATRRGWLAVGVLVVAALIGGGVTYAATGSSVDENTVVICVTDASGQVRVVASRTACKKTEHPLVLQQAVAGGQTAFTVNCAAGQRIGTVLDQVQTGTLPVTITVTGTCTEAVRIDRDNVTLTVPMGPNAGAGITAPDPGSAPVTITGRNVHLGGLTLTGGPSGIQVDNDASLFGNDLRVTGAQTGLTLDQASWANLSGVTVADSAGTGIEMQTGSTLTADDLTITGSGFTGLHVWNGSIANVGSGTISYNHHGGVIVQDGGTAVLGGEISHNDVGGVTSMEGSQVSLSGASIHDNDYWGVDISGGSRVIFSDHNNISANSGSGVTVEDASLGVFQHGDDTTSITDNAAWGVNCSAAPAVAMIAGTPGTVSGNQAGQLNCPIAP